MTERTGGMGPVSPHDKQLYEQEYKRGADLFKEALDQYSQSENTLQKQQFKEVMDKAMQVLNDAARELKRQELIKQNQLIAKDLSEYKKNPDDYMKEKLNQDLDSAKDKLA